MLFSQLRYFENNDSVGRRSSVLVTAGSNLACKISKNFFIILQTNTSISSYSYRGNFQRSLYTRPKVTDVSVHKCALNYSKVETIRGYMVHNITRL